jgi:hypothetical protein
MTPESRNNGRETAIVRQQNTQTVIEVLEAMFSMLFLRK